MARVPEGHTRIGIEKAAAMCGPRPRRRMAGEQESSVRCSQSKMCFMFSGWTHRFARDHRHGVDYLPYCPREETSLTT